MTTPGIYSVGAGNPSNMPSSAYGIMIIVGSGIAGSLSQVQIAFCGIAVYARRINSAGNYNGEGWNQL